MAHTTGVDHVFSQAAFALRIHALAFPLQVTVLFCATYHVQFHPTNPLDLPVYLTRYLSFNPVLEEMVVVHFEVIFASLESFTFVAT